MRLLCLCFLGLSACLPRHAEPPWAVGIRVRGPEPSGTLWTDPDLPALEDDLPHRAAARETAQQARRVMVQEQTHWWQFVPLAAIVRPRAAFDAEGVEEDRERVERWFHDHGWLDASVALEVTSPRERWRVVTLRVTAGERTEVTPVLGSVETLPAPVEVALQEALPPAGPWVSQTYEVASRRLEGVLRAAGYGQASVTAQRSGDRVTYQVEPGPVVYMDGFRWLGLESIGGAALDRLARNSIRQGAPWDGARLDALVADLTARPAIASVRVEPGPVVDGAAPVTFLVEEAPRLTWHPRYSLGANGALLSATMGAGVETHGVGRRLVTSRGHLDVGYRLLPTTSETPGLLSGNHGPTADALLEWDAPLSVVSRLALYLRAAGLLDVRRGYRSVEPEAAAGVSWSTESTQLVAAAVVDHDAFTASAAQRPVYGRWFGSDGDRFLPSYTLVYPELRLQVDTLDRKVDPRRGLHAEARWTPRAEFRGRPWQRADADVRGFVPLHPRVWTAVIRGWAGATTWEVPDAPRLFGLRYHLGGPYDMRAWSFRRLAAPGWDGTVDDTRVGGNVLLYASLESRHRVHPHLTVTPFVDVGRTWEGWRSRQIGETLYGGVDLQDLTGDVGLGIDAPTPLGMLRTAVAVQPLPTTGLVSAPPRWTWQANLDMRL